MFPMDINTRTENCLNLFLELNNVDTTFKKDLSETTFLLFNNSTIEAINHFIKANEYDEWSKKGMPYGGKSL